MSISAGKLDRKVRFEQATETLADSGQPTRSWVPLINDTARPKGVRCAARRQPSGREIAAAQQQVAIAVVAFDVRYDSVLATVTPHETFRIVHEGRPYNIRDVTEIGRRVGLTFIAEARAE